MLIKSCTCGIVFNNTSGLQKLSDQSLTGMCTCISKYLLVSNLKIICMQFPYHNYLKCMWRSELFHHSYYLLTFLKTKFPSINMFSLCGRIPSSMCWCVVYLIILHNILFTLPYSQSIPFNVSGKELLTNYYKYYFCEITYYLNKL